MSIEGDHRLTLSRQHGTDRPEVLVNHQLFTHTRNALNPANAKQNQPAMSWCVLARRTIPPIIDVANMNRGRCANAHERTGDQDIQSWSVL
jgi:hypothetical protein